MSRVLICGSRDWPMAERQRVANRVAALDAGTVVVTGGARGVDSWANDAAEALEYQTDVIKVTRAEWNTLGKRAGILRNLKMLDTCPDLVVAFHDGKSPGTAHTIAEARRRSIEVEVHTPNQESSPSE